LLGLFPAQGHRDILLTLGQHEEFTLFAAVALDNGQDDADDDLWALAGSVHGWGRIHLVERLARTSPWFHAFSQADATTIDDLLALAEELLPLTAIATGPADEIGLGQPYAAHQCIDIVVQDLGKWPGRGWTLIAAALSSPVTRNRNMAINALTRWPRDTWPDTAMPALRTALLAEPTDSVRQRLVDLPS
jgi:hypothetical protein